jgi:hypothetical protein
MSKRVRPAVNVVLPGAPETTRHYLFFFPKERKLADPIYFSGSHWPPTMTASDKLNLRKVIITYLVVIMT